VRPRFARRVVVVGPGQARAYDPGEWRDAIVAVKHGTIEVEARPAGRRARFGPGDVVTLDGLAVRALRNPGAEPAVLVAVSRRLRAVS
jgi:hypothetical protein